MHTPRRFIALCFLCAGCDAAPHPTRMPAATTPEASPTGGNAATPTAGAPFVSPGGGTSSPGGGAGATGAGRGGMIAPEPEGGAGGNTGGGGSAAIAGGSTGGESPSGGGGAAPQPTTSGFTLHFRDDFDALDLGRWQLMTHSWDSNLALFSADTVKIENGSLVIRLEPAPPGTTDDSGAQKQYLGAEVRSTDTLTYGRVRARAKLATGSAVISALVTIYTPWPADNWNELDIECLGKDPTSVQFNTQIYTGPPTTPPVTTPVAPTQIPRAESLGFDAAADFHIYTIEWTPAGATFSIDDVPRYTWTDRIDLMNLPQNVLLTIWASSSAAWAGPVTEQTAGASAVYDWIELYRYAPP